MPHFVCVCVGEIISLPWFSKELKNDLSKNNCLRGVILILLVSIFVGWGSFFLIVLVPRYKLSSYLCVTLPSNLIYLAFRELVSLHVGCVTMWSWGSHHLVSELGSINQVISFWNFRFLFFPQKKKFHSVQFLLLLIWYHIRKKKSNFILFLTKIYQWHKKKEKKRNEKKRKSHSKRHSFVSAPEN